MDFRPGGQAATEAACLWSGQSSYFRNPRNHFPGLPPPGPRGIPPHRRNLREPGWRPFRSFRLCRRSDLWQRWENRLFHNFPHPGMHRLGLRRPPRSWKRRYFCGLPSFPATTSTWPSSRARMASAMISPSPSGTVTKLRRGKGFQLSDQLCQILLFLFFLSIFLLPERFFLSIETKLLPGHAGYREGFCTVLYYK